MTTTNEAVQAIREIFAANAQRDGEPCDGCISMMIRAVLRQHYGTDILGHYSAALDEIYALRAALAYEARVVEAHLDFKSFPKSRRAIAEEQIERMRTAATHQALSAYEGLSHRLDELQRLGAGTLTRAQWEARDGS